MAPARATRSCWAVKVDTPHRIAPATAASVIALALTFASSNRYLTPGLTPYLTLGLTPHLTPGLTLYLTPGLTPYLTPGQTPYLAPVHRSPEPRQILPRMQARGMTRTG